MVRFFLCSIGFFYPQNDKGVFIMIDRLIDPKELARELGVPVSWIYSRTRQKGPDTIPHLKLGKYCRFRLEEVLDWLKKKQDEQDHAQYRSRSQGAL
jgi:predicted DNA-binding transcriptional regulator AlpA